MYKYGLVGKNISYSFSKAYFTEKFETENINATYENFDISGIQLFPKIISNESELKGLNVTIPYKEKILPYLDSVDDIAQKINAVNTIKILENCSLKGFNTDWYGFEKALKPFLPLQNKKALILGTGGASKAIQFVLEKLGFIYQFVSRNPSENQLSYLQLNKQIITDNCLIINCTPLGTFPNILDFPPIPYQYIGDRHLLFDLIYNPIETTFLGKGKANGAKICNGLKMLEYQAEKAWEIWND